MPPQEHNENSAGPVIAVIIVLAMIILGGLYFWGERGSTSEYGDDSASVESITTQSASDDTSSIEADLYDTNVEELGSELESI